MIETQEAIDNIDAILDVPGITRHLCRPERSRLVARPVSPKLDREEPQILAIYEKLVAAAKKRGQFAGIHNATGAMPP